MKRAPRFAVSALLAAGAMAAIAPAAADLLTTIRARGAGISYCDTALAAAPEGTWVRLSKCGADMFHASFLRDAANGRVWRLVPLRPPAGYAGEPSALAVAVPAESASDPGVFPIRPAAHSAESAIADLDDTYAVVGRRLDVSTAPLDRVEGFDHGLAAAATVIELRHVPPLATHSVRAALAAALITAACVVLVWRPRERTSTAEFRERRPVRWGLVLLAVIVGVLGLGRGLQWYLDPARTADTTQVAADTGAISPLTPEPPPQQPAPPATAAELALLSSPDRGNRLTAATTLRARAITPELISAVDQALAASPDRDLEIQLICLKSRFENDGSLDFLIGRMPADRDAMMRARDEDTGCVVDALTRRIREAPERISTALVPAAFASNPGIRTKALGAFRLIDVPVPPMVIADASTPASGHRHQALRAAIAFGALEKHPAVIDAGLRDESTRSAVTHELCTSPHHNAARMVANAWLDLRAAEVDGLAMGREREQHDVSAALLEVALDTHQHETRRAAAAAHIASLGEVGAIHELRRLGQSLVPGPLKDAADAAVAALEKQQAGGAIPRMRALPR
jgi:hypothetical protein